jgi:hypothetical protein
MEPLTGRNQIASVQVDLGSGQAHSSTLETTDFSLNRAGNGLDISRKSLGHCGAHSCGRHCDGHINSHRRPLDFGKTSGATV